MFRSLIKRIWKTDDNMCKIENLTAREKESSIMQSKRMMEMAILKKNQTEKDKYVLSSIFPNEEVMKKVDKILNAE